MGAASLIPAAVSVFGSVMGDLDNYKAPDMSYTGEYTEEVLNEQIRKDQTARWEPYKDFGVTGANSLRDGYDFRQTPEYQYRQQLGEQSMQGLGGFDQSVLDYGQQRMGAGLDATEEDASYGRMIDRVLIGQNQAAQAGGDTQSYGNALANAYQNTGNRNLMANINQQNAQQGSVNSTLQQLGSIPAYMSQQNYLSGLNSSGSLQNSPMSTQQGYSNTPSYLTRNGY